MTMRGIGRGEGFGRLLRFPLSMLIVAGLAFGGERMAFAQTSDDGETSSTSESSAPTTESVGPAPLLPELDAAGVDEAPAEEAAPSEDAMPSDDATTEEDAEPAAMAALAAGATAGADQGSIAERTLLVEPSPDIAFNGTFTRSVSIEVPAFHGIEPSLALTYSASSTVRGDGLFANWVGAGWRLSGVSDIVRGSRIGGVARFDSSDIYRLNGSELVACGGSVDSPSCSTGGTHATRVESFSKIVRDGSANTWTVYGQGGTRSIFKPLSTWGTTVPGGDGNPDLLRNQYRWLLWQVVDTHGNTVTYSYACQTLPACFPSSIAYNGVQIDFISSVNPAPQTQATGRSVALLDRRLDRVEIRIGGAKLRAYALAHAASPSTALQRLTSVTLYGHDWTVDGSGVVSGTAMPPTSVAYAGPTLGFSWIQQSSSLLVRSRLPGDFNGDGRQDLLEVTRNNTAETCSIRLLLSTGTAMVQAYNGMTITCKSFVTGTTDYGFSVGNFDGDSYDDFVVHSKDSVLVYFTRYNGSGNYSPTGANVSYETFDCPPNTSCSDPHLDAVTYGDFDGNGRMDIALLPEPVTVAGTTGVYSWSGSAFTRIAAGGGGSADTLWRTSDLNGDGRDELLLRTPPGIGAGSNDYTYHVLRLRNGTFQLDLTGTINIPEAEQSISEVLDLYTTTDVDGDGTTDLVRYYIDADDGDPKVRLWLSDGAKFVTRSTVEIQDDCDDHCMLLSGDFDGDGRGDVLLSEKNETLGTVLLSRGNGTWSEQRPPMGAILVTADFSGDGKTDVLGRSGTPVGFFYSTGAIPDLLSSVTSPYGGVTTVAYTPSSAWGGTTASGGKPNLPSVMQTVSSVTVSDGRTSGGVSGTTTFSYGGASWSWSERRFLGFRSATMTLPCSVGETQCPYRAYTFSQSLASAGAAVNVKAYDGAGTLMREQIETLTDRTSPLPYRSLNTGSQTRDYFSGGSRSTSVARTFDAYGNVTQLVEAGKDGSTGDERTTITDYAANTGAYIVGLARRVRIYGAGGTGSTALSDTQLCYDGATACTTAPTKGDLTRQDAWLNTASAYVSSYQEFDSYGNVTATVDPVGNRTETVYDTTYHLFPVQLTNALLQVTSATLSLPCFASATTTDLNGQLTTITYDALCRATYVDLPGDDFLDLNYVSFGNPNSQNISKVFPGPNGVGQLWANSYFDGLGRVVLVGARGPNPTAGSGQTGIWKVTNYDGRGNPVLETLPYYDAGPWPYTSYQYDGLNRVTRTTLPDSAQILTVYGTGYGASPAPGGIGYDYTVTTDPAGRVTITDLDAYGRTVRIHKTLASTSVDTFYRWDPLGNLTGVTDPIGAIWSYTYDTLGRRTQAADPDLGTWTYVYDNAGKLTQQTDARGTVSILAYDALSRVTSKSVTLSGGTPVVTLSYYDEVASGFYNKGLLTRQVNDVGRLCLDYDQAARPVQQRWTVSTTAADCSTNPASTYTVLTAYDDGGRVIGKTYPDGDLVGSTSDPWQYDAAGRLLSIPDLVDAFTYNAGGQTLSASYANGVTTTFDYSVQRQWLNSVTTAKAGGALFSSVYGHDTLGRITTDVITAPGVPVESWTYGYDDLDRLTSATDAVTAANNQTFTYNIGNNILSMTGVGSYTYPAATAARPHAPLTIVGAAMTWDAAGNLTAGRGRTFLWDGENRPASITMTATSLTTLFGYGPDGSRWRKLGPTPSDPSCLTPPPDTVTWTFGPELELVDKPVCSSGSWTNTPTWTKYPHPDAKRVGNASAAESFFLHRDHLVSVRLVTRDDGTVEEQARYTPYGVQTQAATSGATTTESHGYIGERSDPETGLLYLNARYYDPGIAIFVSPDTLAPDVGHVGTNRYAYSGCDPINKSDPTGHFFGIDDAIATSIGGVFGLVGQIGQDIANGEISSFHDYGVSVAAGAVAGEVGYHAAVVGTLAAGPVGGYLAGGAAAGVAGYAVTQALNGEEITLGGMSDAAALGMAAGGIAGKLAGAFGATVAGEVAPAASAAAAAGPLSPAQQLAANKALGETWEATMAATLRSEGLEVGTQITGVTASGVRLRPDLWARNPLTGEVTCVECKASLTAPLTPNQRIGFPEVKQSGITVTGSGAPGFPPGLQTGPHEVQVVRPPGGPSLCC